MEIEQTDYQDLEVDFDRELGRAVALEMIIISLLKSHPHKAELKEAFEETMEDAHHRLPKTPQTNTTQISEERVQMVSKAFHDEIYFLRNQVGL